MYSSAAIISLVERIGFGPENDNGLEVPAELKAGTSGRTLPYFHKLATLKNLYHTVEDPYTDYSKFNGYLANFREEAVKNVLTAVLDRHKLYKLDFDYSDTIINRPGIFDDAIGYTMAVMAIEQLVSTSRSNYIETSAKMNYQQLKIELDGLVDDGGVVRVKGIKREQNYAVKQAINAIFNQRPTVYDATHVW